MRRDAEEAAYATGHSVSSSIRGSNIGSNFASPQKALPPPPSHMARADVGSPHGKPPPPPGSPRQQLLQRMPAVAPDDSGSEGTNSEIAATVPQTPTKGADKAAALEAAALKAIGELERLKQGVGRGVARNRQQQLQGVSSDLMAAVEALLVEAGGSPRKGDGASWRRKQSPSSSEGVESTSGVDSNEESEDSAAGAADSRPSKELDPDHRTPRRVRRAKAMPPRGLA